MEQSEQPIPMTGTLQEQEEQDQAAQKQEQTAPSAEHTFGRRHFLRGAGYGSLALTGGSLLAWEGQRGTAHAAANIPLGTLQSPVLIHASDAVQPNQLLSLQGEWLDAASAQVTVNGQAASLVQTDAQGHFLVVRVPQQLTPGIFQATVTTSAGTSVSFSVNQPRPLYISEYEAWAGQQIEIVGRNFDPTEYGASGAPVVKFVVNAGSATYAASVVSYNPYNIAITVPSVPLGMYWIYVSTDNQASWWPVATEALTVVATGQDPLGLGVAWADHFKWNQVFDVTKYGVPTTGGVDVTAQVQAVVNTAKAAGGGVVYFPAGKYEISTINLPAYVVLQGAGADKTTLISPVNGALNTAFINTSGDGTTLGHQGVARLLIELKDDTVRPDSFMWLGEPWDQFSPQTLAERTAAEMFVKNVTISYSLLPPSNSPGTAPRGVGLTWLGKERVICDDNYFVGFHAQPYINFITNYASMKRNYFEYSTGGNIISTGGHTFIENNQVIAHREYNGLWGDLHGPDSRDKSYFAYNTVIGTGTLNGGLNDSNGIFNDGEAVWAEAAGSSNFNYGTVTAATSSTLTLNPVVALVTPYPYYGYVGVAIIDGRGLGQLRKVTNLDIPNNQLTIDRPWDIIPDTTSAFCLLSPIEQVTHYRNTIIGCTKGFYLFGNHFDAVCAENTSIDSEGYFVWAVRSAPNPPQKPSFSGFIPDYFVRFARNKMMGISVKSQHSGINYNLGRFDQNGGYFGTMAYGIEMVDNFISGDPSIVPSTSSLVTEAAPYSGLAAVAAIYCIPYQNNPGSGDAKNTVMARNQLTELSTGVTLRGSVYGTVVADNTYSQTVGTFLTGLNIDLNSANTAVTNNYQVNGSSNFQSNLTGWSIVDGGTWTPQMHGAQGTTPVGTNSFYMATQSGTNFTYQADVSLSTAGSTYAQLVFRSQPNPYNGAYLLLVTPTSVILAKEPYAPLAGYSTTIALNTVYHFTIVANGTSLQVFLNNGTTPIIQVTDSSYASGFFGLGVGNGGTAVFQNVAVGNFANFQTNLSGWSIVDGGSWTTQGDGEHGITPVGTNSFYMATQSGTNFTYQADMSLFTAGSTYAQLVFRSQPNPYNGAYLLLVTPTSVILAKEPYTSIAGYSTTIALNTVYHFKIVTNGTSLQVFLNNGTTPIIQVTDSSYASGLFGIGVGNGGAAAFQNVAVSS